MTKRNAATELAPGGDKAVIIADPRMPLAEIGATGLGLVAAIDRARSRSIGTRQAATMMAEARIQAAMRLRRWR